MASTSIEWTDATWNPVAGCSIVSPGCQNCYAMRMAARLQAMGVEKYRGLTRRSGRRHVWTGRVRLDRDSLATPSRWRSPRLIFVNSMSDLFHEDLPDTAIDEVLDMMRATPQHIYQILSATPQHIYQILEEGRAAAGILHNQGSAGEPLARSFGREPAERCTAHRAIAPSRCPDPLLVLRAASRRLRVAQPFRHPLGDRRWRIGTESPPHGGAVGRVYPTAMRVRRTSRTFLSSGAPGAPTVRAAPSTPTAGCSTAELGTPFPRRREDRSEGRRRPLG